MIPKFRAWDVHDKEMFANDQIIIWDSNVYANDPGKITVDKMRGWSIDEKYLMQSTGLFDKNGKEIFEGDVVKFNDIWSEYDYEGYVDGTSEGENFTEIIKTEDGFSFGRTKIPESCVFYFLNEEHMKFSEIVKSDDFSMVVIGNVYENPELVEG